MPQDPPQDNQHNQHAQVAEFLQDRSVYPDRPAHVEIRETHISLVYLTDRHVYKLKKPVRLDFLDFSTPSLRRQACEDELRLNRRLAAEVYLNVVPVTRSADGSLALDGAGEPVEWLVKMQRLEDQATLHARIDDDNVSAEDVDRIVECLWSFFQRQSAAAVTPEEYVERFDEHIRANLETLLQESGEESAAGDALRRRIQRIHQQSLQYLQTRREEVFRRVTDGHVIEAHGDLRPDHVYLTSPPVFLDCIEFNIEFRTNDMLDELCFLAMECSQLGADWIGQRLLARYAENSGDHPPRSLQAFYLSYRACVRAKVALLRASQLPLESRDGPVAAAEAYLRQADGQARHLGPPVLLVVRGAAGVGKTSVARLVADRLGCDHLQTDELRRQVLGTPAAEDSTASDSPNAAASSGYNKGRYSAENRLRVYKQMFAEAAQRLESGTSVVLDGAFLSQKLMRQAADRATGQGAAVLIASCRCPEATAVARIQERARQGTSLSEAAAETHRRQRQEQESPDSGSPHVEIDTTAPLETNVSSLLERLGQLAAADAKTHEA